MPYYVYKVLPGKKLELVQPHNAYKDAKTQTITLRKALAPGEDCGFRVIYAQSPMDAERLLLTERPYQVMGEE